MTASIPGYPDRDALPQPEPLLWLSALADGDRQALAPGAALWREDRQAREAWHLYHLIGDVLRSEDLACSPARDAAFLDGLRARLAAEPVPLAPAPLLAPPMTRRLGWRAPAAVAAGFVLVGVTLVLLRPGDSGGLSGPGGFGVDGARVQLSAAPASVAGGNGVRVAVNPQPKAGAVPVGEVQMIRDARLDAYLRAHQSARGTLPAVLPWGGMRSAELLVLPDLPLMPPQSLRAASEPR